MAQFVHVADSEGKYIVYWWPPLAGVVSPSKPRPMVVFIIIIIGGLLYGCSDAVLCSCSLFSVTDC